MDADLPAGPSGARRGPGGPIPLTVRQSGVAALLVLVVALATSTALPVTAALAARRVVPPGAVVVGRASFLPADGWALTQNRPDAALVTRAGTRMLVTYSPLAAGADAPAAALQALGSRVAQDEPGIRAVGGVRTFTTVTGDDGLLQVFASPGDTGAFAVVDGAGGRVLVEAVGPTTSFAPTSGDVAEMVTGLRLLQEGA